MSAPLDDLPVIDHKYLMGIGDRTEPMGYHKARPALLQFPDCSLDGSFSAGVHVTCCFIEDQDPRVGNHRPGDGQQLPLSLREIPPAIREDGRVAFWKPGDEFMAVCVFCSLDTFLIGGSPPSVFQVVHDRV